MRKNVILTVASVLCVFAIPVCVHAEKETQERNYVNAVPTYQPPIASTPTVAPCCVLPSSTAVFPVPVPEFAKAMQTMQTQLVAAHFAAFGETYETYVEAEKVMLCGEMDLLTFLQVKLYYLNSAIRLYREIAPPRAIAMLEERVETAELYASLLEEELENAKDDDMRASLKKLLVAARYIRDTAKKEWEKAKPAPVVAYPAVPYGPGYPPAPYERDASPYGPASAVVPAYTPVIPSTNPAVPATPVPVR